MNLKTGVAYRNYSNTNERSPQPKESTPRLKELARWAGEVPPDKVGCWTAQPHGERMRKQDRSSTADCREYLFIGNMVGAGKLQSGQLSPAALEKSGHFCPREGRAGGNFFRQPRLISPHLTRPGPSSWTVAALSPGRCSVPLCHTQLGMPEPFSPNPSFSVYCL